MLLTVVIVKTLVVTVVLAVMILLLLSLNHIFSGNFNARNKDAETLREDIKTRNDVITDQNLFRALVRIRVRNKKP